MSLLSLSNEVLLEVASHFKYESDIHSLMRVSGRLYHLLNPCLYRFNARYYGGSALIWALDNNVVSAAEKAIEAGALSENIVGDGETLQKPVPTIPGDKGSAKKSRQETILLSPGGTVQRDIANTCLGRHLAYS